MKLENFAVLVRVDGVTGQIHLTHEEQRLFSRIVIGTLGDTHGRAAFVPISTVDLPPDFKAFPRE